MRKGRFRYALFLLQESDRMDYFKPNMSPAAVNAVSMLGLAHIGDAVYEVMTRAALCEDEGMVIFHSKSWRTDSGFYNALTQTFTPSPGVTMTEDEQAEYVSYMKKVAANKLNMTAKIIENDFYAAMRKYIN